ncbi:hypothetical protein B0H16DRAFT_1531762 [Mycena metata]|uniref:Uncharacterized protein n=1 Tax=Mycena metata TaxID=1033252 RepID=A0AAD7NI77_9AGAR|nr:hypothetical protein B0H16DRAFT_1531762 [Mycena metata]
MYFHNAATHCYPRDTSCTKEICWKPLHLINLAQAPVPATKRDQYFELYPGSKALPRAQRSRTGTTHFQLPSGGGDGGKAYVLSWPPPISGLSTAPSRASSSERAYFTSPSVTSYITPTLSTPRTDRSDLSPGDVANGSMQSGQSISRVSQRREPRPKGWARLRPNAPPPLQIEHNKLATQSSCILESSDEDEGLVMLLWARRPAL